MVAATAGYTGETRWDPENRMGKTLHAGIGATVAWYRADEVRSP
jgi:hypothetical protein